MRSIIDVVSHETRIGRAPDFHLLCPERRQGDAAELRRRLQAEGFALWQDLTDMEGGRDWWRQITGVIDQIEYLLLVMTPNALRSKVVRDEWRYGRQQGRCVIPIMGHPSFES